MRDNLPQPPPGGGARRRCHGLAAVRGGGGGGPGVLPGGAAGAVRRHVELGEEVQTRLVLAEVGRQRRHLRPLVRLRLRRRHDSVDSAAIATGCVGKLAVPSATVPVVAARRPAAHRGALTTLISALHRDSFRHGFRHGCCGLAQPAQQVDGDQQRVEPMRVRPRMDPAGSGGT